MCVCVCVCARARVRVCVRACVHACMLYTCTCAYSSSACKVWHCVTLVLCKLAGWAGGVPVCIHYHYLCDSHYLHGHFPSLQYPSAIKGLKFDPNFAIRGLHCDIKKGYLMKIDAYNHIQLSSVHRWVGQLIIIRSYMYIVTCRGSIGISQHERLTPPPLEIFKSMYTCVVLDMTDMWLHYSGLQWGCTLILCYLLSRALYLQH